MSVLHVLVVDDSLTIRAILETLLQRSGTCEAVGAAPDVASARMLMATHPPDVVLLDLVLPDADGWDFLAELGRHPHVPVVVVSSATTEGSDASVRAIRLGAAACFDKALLIRDGARLIQVLRGAVRARYRARLAEMDRQDRREQALFG